MTRWYHPTVENYFDHVSKARILEALTEAGKEAGDARRQMKKSQLAKLAESDLSGTGWLPKPFRISATNPQEAETTKSDG